MLHRVAFLCLFSLFSLISKGQQAYLEFDTTCMTRLEYKGANTSSPYISYSALLPNGFLLIMDVGVKEPTILRNKPSRIYKCQNFNLTLADINQINNGEIQLSVYSEEASRLNAYPVDKVTMMQHNGRGINVYTQDAVFTFNPDSLVSGKNLAADNSQMQVYLEGIVKTQCAEGYIFRKKENAEANSFKEWVIIPEIGIVEKSSIKGGGFLSDIQKSTLSLNKVGDQPYFDFLTSWCDHVQASYYDGKNPKTGNDYKDLVETQKVDSLSKASSTDPCAPSKETGIHVVQKGETLYSLSRRYGVSLADIKKWNGLENTDVISICQRLIVADPIVLGSVKKLDQKEAENPSLGESVFTQPPKVVDSTWKDAPEYHSVKLGETVKMLAYMYGYTEERFRKMNGLSSSEEVIPGQKLRTSHCVCPPSSPSNSSASGDVPVTNKEDVVKDTADVFFKPIRVHVVQKSDTLYSIAKQYDTTPERIMELNDLKKGDKLRTGQKLYVQ